MKRLLLLLIIFTTSCSGYRVRDRSNPFKDNNIRNLAIPMFVNHSLYPGVGPIFTREITKLLSTYSGLSLSTSPKVSTNGVLLGVITSPRQYRSAYKTSATKFTTGELKDSIGERAQFYAPTASRYIISIRLVLIKNPTLEEKKLLLSNLGDQILKNPKIVFNHTFNYTGSFNLESKDTVSSDSGGIVNYTKTKRYFTQTIEQMSKSMARDFEDLVINVF